MNGGSLKTIMLLGFAVGALWDGLTTAFGIGGIIGAENVVGYAMSLVGAVMVASFGLGTRLIFGRSGPAYVALRLFWLLAVAFDVYTALLGNARYVVGSDLGSMTAGQWFVVGALTLMVSGSPVFISYLFEDDGHGGE